MLHPLLWACCPALFLYAHNAAQLSLDELPLPVLLSLALAIGLWGGVWLCLRDSRRSATVTTVLVLYIFTCGHGYALASAQVGYFTGWPVVYLVLWGVIVTGSVTLLVRHRRFLREITAMLNVAGLLFLAVVLFAISQLEIPRRLHARKAAVTEQQQTVATSAHGQLPNIYYIILDSYAGTGVLERIYHYDNHPFTAMLQRKGFYVAEQSHANYCQTIVSLACSLNFRYLDDLPQKYGAASGDRQPLRTMIRNPRLCEVLREHRYRIVTLPVPYKEVDLQGDVVMEGVGEASDFQHALLETTPWLPLQAGNTPAYDPYANHRRHILSMFRNIPRVPSRPGPVFVFAHILAPHQPLVFDEAGRPLKADPQAVLANDRNEGTTPRERAEYVKRYRGEVRFLYRKIEEMVDGILARATRPTVIILQGDHGPGFLPDGDAPGSLNIPERFSMLNALYLPNGGAKQLYPGISPVNNFRVVLNYYLGTNYPLLPDKSYYSGFLHPYHFLDVTAQARAMPTPSDSGR
ncbi:MAG: sulfatase-like hydrolase/transferase [Armatimonadota bacterium]